MLLSFHVKCKKALDRENNCHSMGAYCPTLIAASHSFHRTMARARSHILIWNLLVTRKVIQITEKVVPLVLAKSEFLE